MSITGIGGFSPPSIPSAASSAAPPAPPDPTTNPVQWLMDYGRMTPAQRMHQALLQSLGVTQAQYDAMSPADKAKVDQKIQHKLQQDMQQQAEKKSGMLVDVQA